MPTLYRRLLASLAVAGLAVLLLPLPASAAKAAKTGAAQEYRYTILFSGHVAGGMVTRVAADGGISTDYSYSENGRGPDYRETIRLGRDGLMERFAITGKSTFGALVDERYERKGAIGTWGGVVDRGSQPLSGPTLYVPIESTLEVAGLAQRALIRAPGLRLPSVPGGELRTRKVATATVTQGTQRRRVTLWATVGAGLEPFYLWMNADGERAFALIFPGYFQMVEKGWESQAAALEKQQAAAQNADLRAIAQRNRHALPQPLLIRNARVFDAQKAVLGPPQDVFVNQGRIAAIYEAGAKVEGAATVFDAAGRALLPGLFDMHAHVSPGDYLLNLAAGITTVRDLGSDNDTLAGYMGKLEQHESIGPRVVPAGFIEGKSQFQSNGGVLVNSLDEAKKAIDYYAQRGYPQIKIYNSFNPQWVAATTAYAHQRGLRVSGHVPAFMKAEDVVRQGYDEINHINQVLLNFFVKPDTDTRTLARFTLVAENAHALDLDGAPFRDLTKLLVEKKTVLDPTLAVFEAQFTQKPGELNPSYAAVAPNLPSVLRRGLYKSESELTEEIAPRWRASYAKMIDAIGRFHRAGVPLVAGTDGFAGFTLQRELELYVKAGIPASEALRIATLNGATYTRTLADRGTIEPGKRADLILVDGDPTTDISSLRKLSLVLHDGDVYYPEALYREMGVQPFTPALKPLAAAKP